MRIGEMYFFVNAGQNANFRAYGFKHSIKLCNVKGLINYTSLQNQSNIKYKYTRHE